jgi:hypothetical protein
MNATKPPTPNAEPWAVMSHAEIGKRMGMSKRMVRYYERRALLKLRALITEKESILNVPAVRVTTKP